MHTLNEMLRKNAVDHPDKTAVIYQERKITYRELDEITNRIANRFIRLGLQKGDRVAIMLPRIPELVFSYLGLSKCGGIGFPLGSELTAQTIGLIVADTEPFSLITIRSLLPLFSAATKKIFQIAPIVINAGSSDKFRPFSDLLRGEGSKSPRGEISPDDVFYLNYTSGSTGSPKGAVTTHSNIFFNSRAAAEQLGLTEDDVHLCLFAPFSHPHEIFSRPLYLAGTMVMLDKVSSPGILAEVIRRQGVTAMMGLAPFYEQLWQAAGTRRFDLGSLRIAESGGMLTSVDLQRRFKQRFSIPIIPVWGSTETSGIAIAHSPGGERKAASIGTACNYYQVKLIDEEGREVPIGEAGEMVFSGPAVVKSYYNSTGNHTLQGGSYFSGDLARKDQDGLFYFLGRRHGMLKVGGWKVYPHEIEVVLTSHPGIAEAAVIGIRDRLRESVPAAFISLQPGWELSEREIIGYCQEHLSRYKLPRSVKFVESFPRLPNGKIDRDSLPGFP